MLYRTNTILVKELDGINKYVFEINENYLLNRGDFAKHIRRYNKLTS
jgi:hypothetical protein